jgi:hypothetical protein
VLLLLQWREAEALTFKPHSFARLKQLPELRQIISHAAVPAIHSCAGMMQQLAAASQSQLDLETENEIIALARRIPQRIPGVARHAELVEIQRKADAILARRAAAAAAKAAKDRRSEADADGAIVQSTAAAAVEDDIDDEETELFSADVKRKIQEAWSSDSEASLLEHLAPGLRLCLAAEVAVGMLCPG